MAKALHPTLRLGTRGSPLALAQAQMVADALRAQGVETEIVPITTSGDMIQDRPLAELGGKALWTKELDRALIEGRTDLSVHSMKDVETIRPGMLAIGAMLERADTRDRLIGAEGLAALPHGARIGTSSPRRAAQLLARRPDLEVAPIRGNVQTRLAKIERGEFDATLLAAAGLDRLGLDIGTPLDLLPAPAQGAIGVEILAERGELRALLAAIDHAPTHEAVDRERAFLAALGGDCHSAVAALSGDDMFRAEILLSDGSEVRAGEGDPAELAQRLLDQAGPALRAMFGR
ncbi:MAG TPA: hydroxymethylbilane synthase [Allosphingosinicella sp.]|nr:hydroxymethylbilane synthase [Allosphingosinicella sp.]